MTDGSLRRRAVGVPLRIAVLLLASACGGPPLPNVVLISIDSLRPDHDSYGTAIIDEEHKLLTVSGAAGERIRHFLFDSLDDPGERRDLAEILLDRRASLAAKQVEWSALAAQARLAAEGVREIDPAVLERLRSIGYIR